MKKALKGFSSLSIFPITTDTSEAYAVGAKTPIPFAKSITRSPIVSSNAEFADDTIYADDKVVEGEDFEIEVAELEINIKPLLEGGTYDSATKVYSYNTTDSAPEFGATFRGLKKDGNYRMFKYYRAVVSSIQLDLETVGNSTGSKPVKISGKFLPRSCDNKLRDEKDTESASDLTWLDSIVAVPTPVEEEDGE